MTLIAALPPFLYALAGVCLWVAGMWAISEPDDPWRYVMEGP